MPPTEKNGTTPALKKSLRAVQQLGESDARSVAEKTGREYGRESSYLNKLTRMGLLVKRRTGHQVLFSLRPTQLTILRLSGSTITLKDKACTANLGTIRRLSEEIASALKAKKGPRRLIILHGGGSYGHPIARKYRLPTTTTPQEYKHEVIGIAKTRNALERLSWIVVNELLDKGVPAYLVVPQGMIYDVEWEVNLEMLSLLLNQGFVPVIRPDVLIDNRRNARILLPEEMISILAKTFKPSRVLIGTDVDGLYSADPKLSSEAEIIKELHAETLDKIHFGPTKFVDITGGMLGKARYALDVARLGIEVRVVNATKPRIIERALCGESVLGTVVKP